MILTMGELLSEVFAVLRAGGMDGAETKAALLDRLMPAIFAGYAELMAAQPDLPSPAGSAIGRKDNALSGNVGLQAAEALGVPGARLLKTLMVLVDDADACALVPADRELSTRKLAAALGGHSARLMAREQAERATGYVVGGISPFGQRRRIPVAIEEAALAQARVFVNAGRRGLQVKLAPDKIAQVLGAIVAPICR